MGNSEARAAKWATFLASRNEFPARERFLAAFKSGRITRTCECGCNSFDIEVPEESGVPLLARPGNYGAVFELMFATVEPTGSIEFTIFVGKSGHLASVDVSHCANALPVPDEFVIIEPPYHARVSEALGV
ncbi:hypothetical protein [Ideonella sp.]|uniref:hypothetical protein n=1 Tax=Ideonella sp. TaxID=1929293 RepID=UPI0035B0463E